MDCLIDKKDLIRQRIKSIVDNLIKNFYMKNKTKTTIFILLFIMSFSSAMSQVQQPNLSTEIIGTWIAENDNTYKLVFTQAGHMKTYFNNVLSSDFLFSITTQCRGQILTSNYDIFLKLIDTEGNDIYCNYLNGIHTDSSGIKTLSIRTESGKLTLYTKQ